MSFSRQLATKCLDMLHDDGTIPHCVVDKQIIEGTVFHKPNLSRDM